MRWLAWYVGCSRSRVMFSPPTPTPPPVLNNSFNSPGSSNNSSKVLGPCPGPRSRVCEVALEAEQTPFEHVPADHPGAHAQGHRDDDVRAEAGERRAKTGCQLRVGEQGEEG